MDAGLPKRERLCGKTAVETLLGRGKGGTFSCIRYRFTDRGDNGPSRILFSVPKRNFKRAVKRNLLKRRMREAYRLQKSLAPVGTDILFVYICKDVLPMEDVFAAVGSALEEISAK